MKGKIAFGVGKDIDLSRVTPATRLELQAHLPDLRKQNQRAEGVYRRLFELNLPGVLLADEVGKGKTYVALGVAAALLALRPRAKVLILTHSQRMAKEWESRWSDKNFMPQYCRKSWSQHWQGRWKPKRFWSTDDLLESFEEGGGPSVSIGSFDSLRRFGEPKHYVAVINCVLRSAYRVFDIRLKAAEKRKLARAALDSMGLKFHFNQTPPSVSVEASEAERFLRKFFDPDKKDWHQKKISGIERELAKLIGFHLSKDLHVDLLIVDEAHKLEGAKRHQVIEALLHKRFRKCLYLTATPFSLDIRQFRRRLLDFRHAKSVPPGYEAVINALPFDEYKAAVQKNEEFAGKDALENELRRYMVRETWDHDAERERVTWVANCDSDAVLPTLLLERVIAGGRTHIANRRESLCSSWAAAAKTLRERPIAGLDERWDRKFLRMIVRGSGRVRVDPKMRRAVDEISKMVEQGEKVVVFTQRTETSVKLRECLESHPRMRRLNREMALAARRWASRRARIFADSEGSMILENKQRAPRAAKIIGHTLGTPRKYERSWVRKWLRDYGELCTPESDKWLGDQRRLPLVVRYDSRSGDEESHPVEKFNLPCAPYVIIATAKGQEGIDLHKFCRRVVLYDWTWNPAAMEQRIGRVHRIGGACGPNRKVEVIHCYQKGTYDEVMANRVAERSKMMHVLLGAGEWLDKDQEIDGLEKYLMTFPPELPRSEV